MVVQNQVAGIWCVLPSVRRDRTGVRPNGLDTLTMSHPYTIHVSEVVVRLTRCPMTDDVELWDRDTERVEGLDVGSRCKAIVGEALSKTPLPLTADVEC